MKYTKGTWQANSKGHIKVGARVVARVSVDAASYDPKEMEGNAKLIENAPIYHESLLKICEVIGKQNLSSDSKVFLIHEEIHNLMSNLSES